MNYKSLFSSLLITLSLFISLPVIAQTSPEASLDNCFDYYTFQSVQVSVGTVENDYKAGDTVSFVGEIINQNPYPVVDGYVFARIGRTNPNYTTEGHYAVSEFIALGPISIDASSTKRVSFDWESPTNLGSGEYRADHFFSVDKQFNLGGLPFTNEIIVGFDTFNISSSETGSVYLDRAGTKVNGTKYDQIGNWPRVEEDSKVLISQSLRNTTNKEQNVSVSYKLYYWDSLNDKDLISEKEETLAISKGQSKVLSYEIPKVEKSVYYLKITATTEEGAQSILNVRLSSEIESPRINYFGITGFPLKKGENVKLFSCFHNTSNLSTEGRVVLSAKDKDGNEISNVEYIGLIPSSVSAKASDLLASKDLTYIKLDQTLYDREGNIKYQNSEVYDCSTLDSKKCREMEFPIVTIVFAVIAVLFLLLFIIYTKKNKQLSILFLALAVIFAVVGAMLRYSESVFAESTSGDGKTKTEVKTGYFGWYKGDTQVVYGNISLTHNITLNGNLTLNPGDTISFARSTDCAFNITGATWDTPYCGSGVSFTDSTGRNGYLALERTANSMTVTSSDSNKLSCSGVICTAGSTSGAVNVYVTVDSSTVDDVSGSYVNVKLDGSGTENGSICPDGTRDAVACGGTITNANHKMNLYQKDTTNILVIPSYQTSNWSITINQPPADTPSVSCTASPSSVNVNTNTTWTATASGGNGTYTYSWSGDVTGNTATLSGKQFTTAGSKTGTVTVTSNGKTSSASCFLTVTDPSAPSVSCSANPININMGQSSTWTASPSGGNGTYSYSWGGSDGLSGSTQSVAKIYTGNGTKTAYVTVTSNGESSAMTNCSNSVTVNNTTQWSCSGPSGAYLSSPLITVTRNVPDFVPGVTGSIAYSENGVMNYFGGSSSAINSVYFSPGTYDTFFYRIWPYVFGGASFDLYCPTLLVKNCETCESLGRRYGNIDDGCGHIINCGPDLNASCSYSITGEPVVGETFQTTLDINGLTPVDKAGVNVDAYAVYAETDGGYTFDGHRQSGWIYTATIPNIEEMDYVRISFTAQVPGYVQIQKDCMRGIKNIKCDSPSLVAVGENITRNLKGLFENPPEPKWFWVWRDKGMTTTTLEYIGNPWVTSYDDTGFKSVFVEFKVFDKCPCGGNYPNCSYCPPPNPGCPCGGSGHDCYACRTEGGGCPCGGWPPDNCRDCPQSTTINCPSVQVYNPPKCGSLATTTPYTIWPPSPRQYCSSGSLSGSDPGVPNPGETINWACTKKVSGEDKFAYCQASMKSNEVVSECSISQQNEGKVLPENTVYINKSATLNSTISGYDDYNFRWYDKTGGTKELIGREKNSNKIFTKVGKKHIVLEITKPESSGLMCEFQANVIMGNDTVIEQ